MLRTCVSYNVNLVKPQSKITIKILIRKFDQSLTFKTNKIKFIIISNKSERSFFYK